MKGTQMDSMMLSQMMLRGLEAEMRRVALLLRGQQRVSLRP